jgi:serine/threonine protein phosphatase PrpC
MVSLQNGSKQDFFVQGQVGDMHYLGVMDGHGGHACINYVRSLDFDFIASQPDPAKTLWDLVQAKDFYGSGCTFTFARITDQIEVWNMGDSMTQVFVNDQVFTSEIHTFLNPKEVERTRCLVERLEHTTAPHIMGGYIQDMPSIVGHFLSGDKMVPSQSLGHNGCTGFAPYKKVIPYKSTDRIRIVCVSDGVTDMQVDLSEGSAMDIAKEAERKWNKTWMYKGHELKFASGDDVSCVVWENTVVEFPSLCIPYAPAFFTEQDVRSILDTLLDAYIRKIDEVEVKDHKVFFVHFNPGVLLPVLREMYTKLHENKPVKIWVRERWYWHIRLSNPPMPIRKVGWQYDRWDGTGDYYEFAKEEIHETTASKMMQFFETF